MPSIQLRIVDDEIQVAGDHVNQGYLDPSQEDDTKIHMDGRVWHRTGDAGRLGVDGRLWLLGRHSERMQTPDGMVFPFALEAVARSWPGVSRAAVCALPRGSVLAIEGDRAQLARWTKEAAHYGSAEICHLPSIPVDRRHGSKIDYDRLRALLIKSKR
ncbi:MAG: hypothetical protein AAGC79_17835 [Pseudomonadota bacterium]